jgi:hypothetical protein
MKARLVLFALFFIAAANAQSWQWGQRGGSAETISPDYEDVRAIETDSEGNVFFLAPVGSFALTIGSQNKTSYGYRDFMIGSFACDGTLRWSTVIGGYGEDYVSNLHVDSYGDVYIAVSKITYGSEFDGRFHFDPTHIINETYENNKQMFIVKYSGDTGAYLWHKALQTDGLSTPEYYNSRILDFLIDDDGSLYLLCDLIPGSYVDGQFINTMTGNNRFILKLTSDGAFVSAVPVTMSFVNSQNNRKRIAFKKSTFNNHFYLAGYRFPESGETASFGGQNVTGDMYLASYDVDGQFLWLKTDDVAGGNNGIMDMFIEDTGEVYITGTSKNGDSFLGYNVISTVAYRIPTVFKLTADGNLIWGSNPSYSSGATYSNGVTVVGNEVFIATALNAFTWDTASHTADLGNGVSPYVFRFNKSTGVMTGYGSLANNNGSNENARLITSDHNGSVYIGGDLETTLNVNGTTLMSNGGGKDFFIAKYGSSNCSLGFEDYEHNGLKAYPNPAVDELYKCRRLDFICYI